MSFHRFFLQRTLNDSNLHAEMKMAPLKSLISVLLVVLVQLATSNFAPLRPERQGHLLENKHGQDIFQLGQWVKPAAAGVFDGALDKRQNGCSNQTTSGKPAQFTE